MKKILFTLMLLLSGTTAAWAGEGNGTKEHPFTGEWQARELGPELEIGKYLAFDCVIKDGSITVVDTRLHKTVAYGWPNWSPGNLIDNPQDGSPYVQYGKDNPPANRKSQSFILTEVSPSAKTSTTFTLRGYFSGFYTTPDAEGFVYVESAEQMKIILKGNTNVQANAHAKIRLTDNIYLSDLGVEMETMCSTFYGTLDGDGHTIYGDHYGDNSTERRDRNYLFTKSNGATFKNLTFKHIQKYSKNDSIQAIITSYATNGCVFENITFDNVGVSTEEKIAGAAAGIATHSTFTNIKVLNSDFFVDDRFVGAVVGQAGWCTFKNIEICQCECKGDLCAGGVGGAIQECSVEQISVINSQFKMHESISASIGPYIRESGNYAGGVTGYALNCSISHTVVESCKCFCECDNAGGIAGKVSNGTTITDAKVLNCYISTEGASAGGIAGISNDSHYTNCQVDDQTCIFADGTANYSWVAGIVGYSKHDELRNCINSALVAGDYNDIGGIVGFSYSNSLIENCMNTGIIMSIDEDDLSEVLVKYQKKSFGTPITTIRYGSNEYQVQILDEDSKTLIDNDNEIGGIAGYASQTQIVNCSNFGPFYSKGKCVSGIVGEVNNKAKTINCFNAPTGKDGFPDSGDNHGGIIGAFYEDTSIEDSIIDAIFGDGDEVSPAEAISCLNLNGQKMLGSSENITGSNNYCKSSSYSTVVHRVTDELLASGYVAYQLNNNAYNKEHDIMPWRQNLGGDATAYPVLDATLNVVDYDYLVHSTAAITTADQLREFAEKVNEGHNPGFAYLDADITFTDGIAHLPIGNRAHPFWGLFEGNGHTIGGLQYHISSDEEGVGLFGVVCGNTTVRNVSVDGTSAFTNHEAGAAGIVGLAIFDNARGNVVIENCASHANIHVNKHGSGILGRIRTGNDEAPESKVTINNCYSMGTITAENGNSALLCGYTKNHAHVSNSWSGGQLRNGDNKGIWPYSIENDKDFPVAECLVGYDTKFDIQNCYIVNPDENVDQYKDFKELYPLQADVEIISQKSCEQGKFTYVLNGYTNDMSNSLRWQQNLGTDLVPVRGNKGVYHTRTVSNEYGTLCLPYALKSDDNISYYTFTESSDSNSEVTLNFDYAETVEPGTPVLFRVAETGEITFSDANNANIGWAENPIKYAPADWNFKGTFEERNFSGDATQTIYYVSNDAIKHSSNKVNIAPFRAYFEGPSIETLTGNGTTQARVRIVIDGEENEAAALQFVTEDFLSTGEGRGEASYTLFGTKAGAGYRGIVVRDGKKVIQN